MKRTPPRLPRWLARTLGGLVFVVFGLVGADLAVGLTRDLSGAWRARDWVRVEGRLVDWTLVRRTQMTTRMWAIHRPLDALAARYVYDWRGTRHAGDRVAFVDRADDFAPGWRAAVVRRLQAAQGGAPLAVWVDPADPSQAVVERDLPAAQATFAAALLLFPCGIATALAVGTVLRAAFGDAANQRLLLPVLGMLHALPALAIVVVAAPGTVGLGSGVVLALLGVLGIAGLIGFVRALQSRR